MSIDYHYLCHASFYDIFTGYVPKQPCRYVILVPGSVNNGNRLRKNGRSLSKTES